MVKLKKINLLTEQFINNLYPHREHFEAHLHKRDIHEALKYNLVNLEATFGEFIALQPNTYFLNVFAMLCRAGQEATATVLYLSDKSAENHEKYNEDLMTNPPQLLHEMLHTLDDNNYPLSMLSKTWSWTNSSYADRIRKTMGAAELAFYRYLCAFAHYAMPNESFLVAHPSDFNKLQLLFLSKISQYIYLNVKKMVELKTLNHAVPILLTSSYVDELNKLATSIDKEFKELILSMEIFQPHTQKSAGRHSEGL